MTGYKLYTRPGSGGFVVEAAFALLGTAFETIDVPKDQMGPGSALRDVNPIGQLPTLILPDGRVMTESAAICLYLGEISSKLGPAPGSKHRADFLRWMLFLSSALYPALLKFYYADRHVSDPAGVEWVKEAAITQSDQYFEVLENELAGRRWLIGDAMTIADVYLAMLAHWHPEGDKPRDAWVNIIRLCNAVKADPVIAALNDRHRMW